jgi:hypothetical protein
MHAELAQFMVSLAHETSHEILWVAAMPGDREQFLDISDPQAAI